MKKDKFVSIDAFLCALVSIPALYWISAVVGDIGIFGVGGAIFYSWIIYFAIVFCALSFTVGVSLRKKDFPHYKKNIVVAVVIAPLALISGSVRLLASPSFDYSDSIVRSVGAKASIILPGRVKVVTDKSGEYLLGNAVIEDANQKEAFEKTLQKPIWATSLEGPIRSALPDYVVIESTVYSFDDFMFFDCGSGLYNAVSSEKGSHGCVFVAYQKGASRLLVVDGYAYMV